MSDRFDIKAADAELARPKPDAPASGTPEWAQSVNDPHANAIVEVLALRQRAEAAEASAEALKVERDSWRDQFDTLRIDMSWTPSEQANEIMRLRKLLNDAAVKVAQIGGTPDAQG